MKKELLVILSFLATNVFAVQIANQTSSQVSNQSITTVNHPVVMDETMKTKVGNVDSIDGNSLTINKTIYKKSIDCRIYGKVTKGSYIKFNTNKSNQLIDIWILK